MKKWFKFLVAIIAILVMAMIAPTAGATVDVEHIYLAPESVLLVSSASLGPQHDLVAPVQIQASMVNNYINDFDLTTSAVSTFTASEHYIDTIGHRSARVPANPQPRHLLRT